MENKYLKSIVGNATMSDPIVIALDFALMIQSYLNLVLYTVLFVVILVKVKKRLILGFGLVLIIFFVYFVIKAIMNTFFYLNHYIFTNNLVELYIFSVVRCLSSLINRMKWFILYHFIMQVNLIVIKIDSESPQTLRLREKSATQIKNIVYSVYLVMAIIMVSLSIIEET